MSSLRTDTFSNNNNGLPRFFYFESTTANLMVYFFISTIVLYYGPDNIPALDPTQNNPILSTPSGDIQGIDYTSRDGRYFTGYLGIPFAKAPIGDLRFKLPQKLPQPAWEGVFKAKSQKSKCLQPLPAPYPLNTAGSEDCLYLNVFVPSIEEEENTELLPVMVFIHGGGFTVGDNSEKGYNPGYLMDKNIIVITISYRLGPFGFLNLGRDGINGNQGLWDQKMALEWIRDNVQSFGGNPQKITISGDSAGAMSVMAHMVTSLSKNLFQSAIVMSGTINSPFVTTFDDVPINEAHELWAKKIGCVAENELTHCLLSKSGSEILAANDFLSNPDCAAHMSVLSFPNPWVPSRDNHMFTSSPNQLLKSGNLMNKVPILIGFNSHEGVIFSGKLAHSEELVHSFKANWDKCLHININSNPQMSDNDLKNINRISKFYFKNKWGLNFDIKSQFMNLTNILSDFIFSGPTDWAVRRLSELQRHPIYYYRFSHVGAFSLGDIFNKQPVAIAQTLLKFGLGYNSSENWGTSHGDGTLYLWRFPFLNFLPRNVDEEMSRLMVELWTNFVISGNPNGRGSSENNPKWEPVSKTKHNYVQLENGRILSEMDSDQTQRFKFWNELMNQ